MNDSGLLLRELHHAETELAEAYRAVAERQSADHGTYYPCHTLADQCDQHAEQLRAWARHLGTVLRPPKRSETLSTARDTLRHKSSELLGHRPKAGLSLLRDLRELYVQAATVNIHWIMLGQVAHALRDHGLLSMVSTLHGENLTQAKWIKTRIKEATPQALLATD
ncbi:hypothetical protein ACGFOU_17050 [Streptomyces sp. NPDC048595]|uniref:hypothetical protein n=1 Tax=Streptomyces sp. NPDC048595 TaxID=3365576 RepID=UPI003723AE13